MVGSHIVLQTNLNFVVGSHIVLQTNLNFAVVPTLFYRQT
ncbi:hypothetical protein LEP1GSC080_2573 [Leptospira interrogans str. FPW2026]|nr:hypothetical protein LEP1GSC080_2573 [Leptospira interrogans str. FPW2026]